MGNEQPGEIGTIYTDVSRCAGLVRNKGPQNPRRRANDALGVAEDARLGCGEEMGGSERVDVMKTGSRDRFRLFIRERIVERPGTGECSKM